MFIYCLAPLPNIDCIAKIGMTGSLDDRISTFNCSSSRPFGGCGWKVNSDPEHWEGLVLSMLNRYRIIRHYGLSEIVRVRDVANDLCQILLENEGEPVKLAWLAQVIAAMGMLSELRCADDYFGDLLCYERHAESQQFRKCVKELSARRVLVLPEAYKELATETRIKNTPIRTY